MNQDLLANLSPYPLLSPHPRCIGFPSLRPCVPGAFAFIPFVGRKLSPPTSMKRLSPSLAGGLPAGAVQDRRGRLKRCEAHRGILAGHVIVRGRAHPYLFHSVLPYDRKHAAHGPRPYPIVKGRNDLRRASVPTQGAATRQPERRVLGRAEVFPKPALPNILAGVDPRGQPRSGDRVQKTVQQVTIGLDAELFTFLLLPLGAFAGFGPPERRATRADELVPS